MPVTSTEQPNAPVIKRPEGPCYSWGGLIQNMVHLAVELCVSEELRERHTNFSNLYDSRYSPIGHHVQLSLGRLGSDGPMTRIDNVEHIRHHTSVNLGAQVGRNCIIKEWVTIKDGAQVGDFCLINHRTVIGEGAQVSTGSSVEYGITVPANEYVAPGSTVTEWNQDKAFVLNDNPATHNALAVVDNCRLAGSDCPDFL